MQAAGTPFCCPLEDSGLLPLSLKRLCCEGRMLPVRMALAFKPRSTCNGALTQDLEQPRKAGSEGTACLNQTSTIRQSRP